MRYVQYPSLRGFGFKTCHSHTVTDPPQTYKISNP